LTKEKRTDVKVGLTVLIGIAVLLFGIAWAKEWTIRVHEQTVRAIFPTAGGLEPGDPVMVNGVKHGAVRSIELGQSNVVVTMALTGHTDLRKDASASIAMLELMSGKKVELIPGSSPEPMPANALIPGNYSGDISSLVATLTSVSATLESIAGKTDTLFTSLNSILGNDEFKGKMNLTMDQARNTLASAGITADRLNALLADEGPSLRHTLQQADTATRYLSQMLSENRPGLKMFIDSGGRAIAEARSTLAKTSLLVARLDSLAAGANRKNTLLYRLMQDDAFAGQVDSALTSITKLSEQLRLQGLDANIRFWNSAKPVK
jgi:phospholipid/cholesterol/gamma-HCH transport system substrate-binding protein